MDLLAYLVFLQILPTQLEYVKICKKTTYSKISHFLGVLRVYARDPLIFGLFENEIDKIGLSN